MLRWLFESDVEPYKNDDRALGIVQLSKGDRGRHSWHYPYKSGITVLDALRLLETGFFSESGSSNEGFS